MSSMWSEWVKAVGDNVNGDEFDEFIVETIQPVIEQEDLSDGFKVIKIFEEPDGSSDEDLEDVKEALRQYGYDEDDLGNEPD